MNKVLSQDEIDALLKGVESGEIETEKEAGESIGLRHFDFTSQERIVRGRMPGLEMANERFARFFRNSASSILMKFIDINIQGIQIVKFGEFMKTIPFPSSINIFKMPPLKGYSLFVIEAPMVFAFVEYFFGGKSARNVKSEGRQFTAIEQGVIRRLVSTAFNDMAEAWGVISPIKPELTESEMNPQFVTIATPAELVIKIEIHLEIEGFKGRMFFCIPYSIVEPVKERIYSGIGTEKFDIDHRWISRLNDILMDSYISIVVEIGSVEMTVRDLMKLEAGSVISLGKAVSEDMTVCVENIKKFKCKPGFSRGSQAVRITDVL